jgi:hypothetical protein
MVFMGVAGLKTCLVHSEDRRRMCLSLSGEHHKCGGKGGGEKTFN